MKTSNFILLGVALALGLSITWYFSRSTNGGEIFGALGGGNSAHWLWTWGAAAYGFAATLCGVFLGSTYRRLLHLKKKGRQRMKPRRLMKDVTTSIDFLMALVGAPIVFGLLWQSISETSLAGLTVIALQNGFSCLAIIGSLAGETDDLEKGSAVPKG